MRGEIEIADLKVSGRPTVKKTAPKKAATKHIAEQPISAGTLAQLKSDNPIASTNFSSEEVSDYERQPT